LLIGFFVVVIFSAILSVNANGTVHIKADGNIDGTDKILRDGNVYKFAENIVNQSVVVEKDNIVIDGDGHSLEGDGKLEGIWLENRYNVTIKKMNISNFGEGIKIMGTGSKNNSIIGNTITCNGHETYGNGI